MIDILYRRPSSSYSSQSIASSGISWLKSASGVPESLSFERIVDRKTCFPCRLQDFMNYLHFVEHNAEYLKFYLWYRDYKKRFYALPESEKELSPVWEEANTNAIPVLRRKASDDDDEDSDEGLVPLDEKRQPGRRNSSMDTGVQDWNSRRTYKSVDIERKNSVVTVKRTEAEKIALRAMEEAHFDGIDEEETLLPFTVQPYRSEIAQMSQVFLASGGALELNLSARDRQATLQALHRTTHPSALLPAIKVAEAALRSHSHPNFARRVVSNSNPDRAASLNYIGYILMALSVAGCVVLTLSHKPRAWRIFPAMGIAIAVGHIISGIRGFCCRLFVSGFQRNLEPWQTFAADDPKLAKITEAANADEESHPVSLEAAALPASVAAAAEARGDWKKGHSPASSASSFDFSFDLEETKRAEENIENFEKQSSFKHAMEPGATVMDPGLRKLHWNMFWQIFLGGWLTFGISCAIFVPLPKGNFF